MLVVGIEPTANIHTIYNCTPPHGAKPAPLHLKIDYIKKIINIIGIIEKIKNL